MGQSNADKLINSIIGYSQKHDHLLRKYNLDFYLNYFDRNTIVQMSTQLHPHQDLNQQQFIRIFLLKIQHTEDETIFLALSLKNIFQTVLERSNSTNSIQFSDFTSFLCQKISKEDLDLVIPSKKIAKEKITPDCHHIRDIDISAPLLLSKVSKEIPKISKDLPKKNKKLDQKKGVSKFYFSETQKNIIAVGTLSSSIFFFDENLRPKLQISPFESKEMDKDIAIISMAYSEKTNRVGAILTNSTIVFWQGYDKFSTEKMIPNKNYGDKIYYFQLSNQWVTVDKSTLNFWDIKQQTITNSIKCKESILISDICEINHLRGICVSMVTSKQEKLIVFYHQGKKMAKINLGNAGCHALHYNKLTQSLIPLGYHNTVSVYTVQTPSFDTSLRYILRGHRSIITCIDSLEHESLMITGDDVGQIRIWELTYMRCVQSLKITKWLCGLKLVGNKLFYSDSRINVMQLDHFQTPKIQKIVAIYQFYDEKQQALWVITRKDARKTDMKLGKLLRIFVLCGDQEEITAACQVGDGFLVGNSKGELFHYDSDCNIRWQKIVHDGEIKQIEYDAKNKLFFTLGSDGKMAAWPEKAMQAQNERKIILFKTKQINNLSISNRSGILIICNPEDKAISIWDYQILKLYEQLNIGRQISTILVCEKVELIIIITQSSQIYFIKFMKKEHNLDLSLIQTVRLNQMIENSEQYSAESMVTGMKLISNEDNRTYFLFLATSRGHIINLDISHIMNQNFKIVTLPSIKQSVNILRNQQENYQNSLLQHGRKSSLSDLLSQYANKSTKSKCLWIKKIFKDGINSIQQISMKNKLLCAVGQQYSKIINIENGQILTSLNINHPLPIKWNISVNHHNQLKKNVYEVLKIIDNILKNHGYQMLAKEYRSINLTNFMQKIKNGDFEAVPSTREIQLLSSQYEPQDFTGQKNVQPSLKSLEAYKRVKLIKKISKEMIYVPQSQSHDKIEAHLQRQSIRQFLMPPKQTSVSPIETNKYIVDLSNKLNKNLPNIENKKLKTGKQYDNQNNKTQFMITNRLNHSTIKDSGLARSMIIQKDKTQKIKDLMEQSSMKQILKNLNQKIKFYRNKKENLQ